MIGSCISRVWKVPVNSTEPFLCLKNSGVICEKRFTYALNNSKDG